MGLSCDLPCVHGDKQPDFTCVCHECMTGRGCNDTCNGYGTCDNDTCSCDPGWRGKCKRNLKFFDWILFICGLSESAANLHSQVWSVQQQIVVNLGSLWIYKYVHRVNWKIISIFHCTTEHARWCRNITRWHKTWLLQNAEVTFEEEELWSCWSFIRCGHK